MTLLLWMALLLVVFGAVMLIGGIGASVIWFAAIATGCALFVVERNRTSQSQGS